MPRERLPADLLFVNESDARAPRANGRPPRAPGIPVPRRIGIFLGGHLLLVRELLLLAVAHVLGIGLLSADIQTAAHQRIGVNVMHDVPVHTSHELMGRQALEHRDALGRIRRQDHETGRGKMVFPLLYALRLTRRDALKGKQHNQRASAASDPMLNKRGQEGCSHCCHSTGARRSGVAG